MLAVLLRAANVGGKNVFKPAQLAKALAHLDVVNIGAAGTFVVRGKASAAAVRREFLAAMPFAIDMVVMPGKDVVTLVESAPFAGVKLSKDLRAWVAALSAKPKTALEVPIVKPEGKAWSVRVDRLEGRFVLGLWQRQPKLSFPNEVVERAAGVPATMRWFETYEKIAKLVK
jgi:uncharacterized protein (DUF1697 family)